MTRRTWLAERTDDLERELAAVGLTAPRAELERRLGAHVESIAAQSGMTVQTARRYVTPETMRVLARGFAEQLADEAPGVDLLAAPRTSPVPIAAVGVLVAALTEVVQLAVAGEDAELVPVCALLSTVGVLLRDHSRLVDGVVDLPPALLTRAARVLGGAADRVRDGACLPLGADEALRSQFSARLAEDAALLRQLGDNADGQVSRPRLRPVKN